MTARFVGEHGNVLGEEIVWFETIRRQVGGAFVVILIPIDRIESMADLARQLGRLVAEEAVAGIPLELDSRPWAGVFGAPLMDVVAGGAGDGSGADELARRGIEEGEERPVVTLGGWQVYDRDRGMMGEGRDLIAGDRLAGMAGPAHRVHQGSAQRGLLDISRPEFRLGGPVVG